MGTDGNPHHSGVTPDYLRTVQRSWAQLRVGRAQLVGVLTHRFALVASPIPPRVHAAWLVDAVDELVGVLAAPSRLETQARRLGATWPDPLTAPSFRVEGQAWLAAADECLGDWS